MKKIFSEYGGVITVAMAIVALVCVVALLVGGPNGGWIGNAFNHTIDKFGDKVDEAISVEKTPELEISGFNYISYSRINGVAHWYNTEQHYLYCAQKDFTSIKGDVRITSDGKLVMCHDAGFTFNENGKITRYDSTNCTLIRDLTEAECLALQYATGDTYVCTFENYISVCKEYDKIAFITIRDEYMDELVPEMMRILKKYVMTNRCIVNSFTYSSLQAVRNAAPSMMLSHVQGYKAGVTIEAIDGAAALGNCLVNGFNFGENSTADFSTSV